MSCLELKHFTSMSSEKTLSLQNTLSSLPLPSIENTCARYLESAKPFLTEQEYLQTEKVIREFEQGEGKQLQSQLMEMSEHSRNWVHYWWSNTYVDYRGPLPLFNNTGGGVDPVGEFDQPMFGVRYKRAAMWIHSALQVYIKIMRQELPVQRLGKKNAADMIQYYKCFCAGRIPGEKKDTLTNSVYVTPKRDGSFDVVWEVRHVIVLMRRRIFRLRVLDDSKEPLTLSEIECQLLKLVDMCESLGDGESVGSLTADDRDTWYQNYAHLCELDIQNRDNVALIHEALFAIAFDEVDTYTLQQSCEHGVLGDCYNRWFDKNITAIVSRTGLIGNNNDHAHCDGNVGTLIYQMTHNNFGKWKSTPVRKGLDDPVELQFVVDDKIKVAILNAQQKHKKLVTSMDLIDCTVKGFGKSFGKSLQQNPDTLIQMAIQLAYYKMHRKSASTYESATTRMFYCGRTETVRSCTSETKLWTEAMMDEARSKDHRRALLLSALKRHSTMMKEATMGQGIDRHFFGLQKLVEIQGLERPAIFEDKAWKLSGGDGNFVLSTSLSGYFTLHGGIAPMTLHGYGAFYTISDACLHLCVTAWKESPQTDCKGFYDAICSSLHDIKELLGGVSKL